MADATLPRSDFYVYILFRHDTGEPFYVGKGRGKRHRSSLRDKHNRRKSGVIKKAKSAGREIPVVKIGSGLSETEAFTLEVAMIAAVGREPRGPLINLTDGGDGTSGHAVSAEARAVLSAYAKAQMTDEARSYLSARATKQWAGQEARDALSRSCSEAQNREDRVLANRTRALERVKDPAFREKLGKWSKEYNSREDVRQIRSERLTKQWENTDYRAAMTRVHSKRMKALWADPEFRKKRLDALKQRHT